LRQLNASGRCQADEPPRFCRRGCMGIHRLMFHRYVFVGSETMLISIIAGTLCSMIDSILSLYSRLLRFKCGFFYMMMCSQPWTVLNWIVVQSSSNCFDVPRDSFKGLICSSCVVYQQKIHRTSLINKSSQEEGSQTNLS
jgi:hypothetical protein